MLRKVVIAAAITVSALGIYSIVQRDHSVSQDTSPAQREQELRSSEPRLTTQPSMVKANQDVASQAIQTDNTRTQTQTDSNRLSPKNDGWNTETLAELALQQLNVLGHRLASSEAFADAKFDDVITADFATGGVAPKKLAEIFRDDMTTVRAWSLSGQNDTKLTHSGAAGLRQSLSDWRDRLPSDLPIEPHFKIVTVTKERGWTTDVLVDVTASQRDVSRQVNASWKCDWEYDGESTPKLRRIALVDYREADVRSDEGWFVDRTTAVIGEDPQLSTQLGHGHHYWLQRFERALRFDTSVRNGLAVGDVNGDGLDDLYVCQPPGLPNRLFVQQTDGTAEERAAQLRVDYLDQSSAALFCDLDNDGDQDLVIGTPAGVLVLENTGTASDQAFQLRATLKCDYDVQSLSAVDYNDDRRLDLFVCVYRTALPSSNRHFLYRDATGGGLNRLFENRVSDDGWGFEDVTDSSGLTDGADRYSLAASWEDFDSDGDQDLYIANDFGPNYLYENREGRFTNIAEKAGVVDIGSGMSVSWGDFNQDGLADLYVGNMFSSAGRRVTTQAKFRPGESEEIRKIYERLAKGNSLFQNNGDGTFQEVGGRAHVELGRWAWSSIFTDLNNDGWEDLLVANGYITTDDTGDL